MSDKEFNKDVRELLIRTKVSTLLRDRPVVLLKQESTVELALQASPFKPYHLPRTDLIIQQTCDLHQLLLARACSIHIATFERPSPGQTSRAST